MSSKVNMMSGAVYERITRQLHHYIVARGLGPEVVKRWTEDDPMLLLTQDEGIFEAEAEPPQYSGRYALLLHVPSDAHDPTCNEEVSRLVIKFDYNQSPSRLRPDLNNAELLVRKLYYNGVESFLKDVPATVLEAALVRIRELLDPTLGSSCRTVSRYVAVQHLPDQGGAVKYWTGVPSQPWTYDRTQAQLYIHEEDALAMSKLLSHAPDAPKHAEYRVARLTVSAPDSALH